MQKAFKVFDTADGGQVLVSRFFDEEDEDFTYGFSLTTVVGFVKVSVKMGMGSKKNENKGFKSYDQEGAEAFRKNMIKAVKGK